MKTLLLFIFLVAGIAARAQDAVPHVHGNVTDSLTGEACSYVRVYNTSRKLGVLAEYTGNFDIEAGSDDILSFNSPGYKELLIVASVLFSGNDTVLLRPEGSVLDELIVLAEDSHLYRWMDMVFDEKVPDRTAKTYMEVETFLDKTQVELVEAYYNGTIRGCDVRLLQFKNGRMAFTRTNNTSFLSTETSKAILQLRLNSGYDYLPDSPFEYPIKKMRKEFKLTLNKTYKSQKGNMVYIISFEPRRKKTNAFSGTIWLDTVTKQALKLSLNAQPAKVHPFIPIFQEDAILSVGLEINYSFSEQTAGQLDFIYFNYTMDYQNRDRDRYLVETNVIVHPYSYDSKFILPYFKMREMRHSDYRNIQTFPYNTDFWELEEHPVSREIQASNEQFFNNREVIYNSDSVMEFQLNSSNEEGFFESPYCFWSPRRIVIKNVLPDRNQSPRVNTSPGVVIPAAQLYQLSAQVYADITFLKGEPHILTATVLDPYRTFYKLPMDSTTDCFLNLYLDILEIERRKFDKRVKDPSFDVKNMGAAYYELKADIDAITQKYFLEVNHGSERKGMEKWNEYVLKELGIDNFRAFGLYRE